MPPCARAAGQGRIAEAAEVAESAGHQTGARQGKPRRFGGRWRERRGGCLAEVRAGKIADRPAGQAGRHRPAMPPRIRSVRRPSRDKPPYVPRGARGRRQQHRRAVSKGQAQPVPRGARGRRQGVAACGPGAKSIPAAPPPPPPKKKRATAAGRFLLRQARAGGRGRAAADVSGAERRMHLPAKRQGRGGRREGGDQVAGSRPAGSPRAQADPRCAPTSTLPLSCR